MLLAISGIIRVLGLKKCEGLAGKDRLYGGFCVSIVGMLREGRSDDLEE